MSRLFIFWLAALLCAANFLQPFKAAAQACPLDKAYPFQLKDTLGKVVKLEDFEGKLLVMDFWFTGCKGCVQLADMLHHAVMPVFEGDTSVVFISVSVDINFLQWKRSLLGGLYTSDKQVNLFTMGLGTMHPLFSHYRFSGCPQMLIINQDGMVISKSVASNAKTLIDLIKQNKTR